MEQPVTFRPRRLRRFVVVAALALLGLTAFGWFALPVEIRLLFTRSQRLTLLACVAVLILTIASVAASSVRADDAGLRFRNGFRVHTVPWSRVHKVLLRPGDPWALLLLTPADGGAFTADLDAEKRMLLGIQAGDRAEAVAAVTELRRRQAAYQRSR
ncbi:MAG: hypothetical protein JWP61_1226 [Friedmanniella sp.]|nr:hypothetical protein [Friedmanniella sp.]